MKVVQLIQVPETFAPRGTAVFLHTTPGNNEYKTIYKSLMSVVMSNFSMYEIMTLTLQAEYGNDIVIETARFEPEMLKYVKKLNLEGI